MICLPAPSAFSLAAARLGWSLQDCATLSLHGRALEAIIPHLQPRARVLALSWDGATPGKLAQIAGRTRHGRARRLIDLRGDGRRAREIRAARSPTNLRLTISRRSTRSRWKSSPDAARASFRARSGLPDAMFEHDGQITKREIRAMTLAALAPRRGELLVGHRRRLRIGGDRMDACRSRQSRHCDRAPSRTRRAHRPQRRGARRSRPADHRRRGARGARRPAAPDAIFVGGGASDRSAARPCSIGALAPGGRLVVNAVTLARASRTRQAIRTPGRRSRAGESSRGPIASAASTAGGPPCRSCNGCWKSHGRNDRHRRRLPQILRERGDRRPGAARARRITRQLRAFAACFSLADKTRRAGPERRPRKRSGSSSSFLPREALAAVAPRLLTRSAAAQSVDSGSASVAEAAALAGAGPDAKIAGAAPGRRTARPARSLSSPSKNRASR